MEWLFWAIPGVPLLWAALFVWPAARLWLRRGALLPVLPALLAVVLVPEGSRVVTSGLLLGVEWQMGGLRTVLLGATALVWLAAAWFARGYLEGDGRRHRFEAIFHLVMAGNFGLLVAADPVAFYTFFALMSLASYALVVHNDTTEALRAGRVYLILALLGEVALFVGLVGHVAGNDALWPLLWLGLAIKAGVVPLHVWLPLAHPAAPVPASAVLSGTMIKAGLFGWWLFPPPEALAPTWGMVMLVLGAAGALYAALVGWTRSRPKEVLAYSSVSQMGVMSAAVGAAWLLPMAAPALLAATVIYAVHHALTKGALFLLAGWLDRSGRPLAWLGLVFAALVMAGLPATSGAAAKQALKEALYTVPVEAGWAVVLLSISAVATTVLMGRLLVVSRAMVRPGDVRPVRPELALACSLALLLVLAAPLVWPPLMGAAGPTVGSGLFDAVWPLLLGGLLVAGLARWRGTRPWGPAIANGDLIALLRALPLGRDGAGLVRPQRMREALRPTPFVPEWLLGRLARRSLALEQRLSRLGATGVALVLLVGLVALLLI